jgi:hypothetical protein
VPLEVLVESSFLERMDPHAFMRCIPALIAIDQAYFTPLFFFISVYFSKLSYAKPGPSQGAPFLAAKRR